MVGRRESWPLVLSAVRSINIDAHECPAQLGTARSLCEDSSILIARRNRLLPELMWGENGMRTDMEVVYAFLDNILQMPSRTLFLDGFNGSSESRKLRHNK